MRRYPKQSAPKVLCDFSPNEEEVIEFVFGEWLSDTFAMLDMAMHRGPCCEGTIVYQAPQCMLQIGFPDVVLKLASRKEKEQWTLTRSRRT